MAREIAPRIAVDPKVRLGKPVVKGTRVPVQVIVGKIAGGMSIREVCEQYDLTREDVLAALRYDAGLVAQEHVMHV